MKVTYDTTECGRCGGTGSYSYCQMYGSVCFDCGGRKVTLSKAGRAAKAAYDAFCKVRRMTKRADEVVVGDLIRSGSDPFRRVTEVHPSSCHGVLSDGTKIPYVDFTFNKAISGPCGKCYSLSTPVSTMVTVAMTAEAQAEAFAFARTLKGATVTE
jgi:hypothetical protein